MLTVLVDDTRNLTADIICRTVEGAIAVLMHLPEALDLLMLDWDLGGTGDTAEEVLKALSLEARMLLPKAIQVISGCPRGRMVLAKWLEDMRYRFNSGDSTWYKVEDPKWLP